jgi:ABC-type nitrate/sulfonate/bicarbonate transport system substrate-binding protein
LPCLLPSPRTAAEKLTVALDWTPNTNHVGLYVAQAKGWFTDAGLDVEILPYTDTSSGTLVATGVAQFGILSAVGFHSQRSMGADMTAVMAVVQHETGRLVFNGEREDIQRPADLDGKTYAGFGSAWENALISSIIRHDGGEGSFDTVTLGTSAYEALANGSVDFTLEVSTWEGVNSVLLGRPQRCLQLCRLWRAGPAHHLPGRQCQLACGQSRNSRAPSSRPRSAAMPSPRTIQPRQPVTF